MDTEPPEFNFLNEVQMLMDLSTIYIMIFAMINWPKATTFCCYAVGIAATLPVILLLLIPPIGADEEFDDDGNIVGVRGSPNGIFRPCVRLVREAGKF